MTEQTYKTSAELVERTTVSATLSNAQKYIGKLKGAAHASTSGTTKRKNYGHGAAVWGESDSETLTTEIDMLSLLSQCSTVDELVQQVELEKQKQLQKVNDKRVVSLDISNLKEAIHKKNSECGVSNILTTLDFINAEIAHTKSILVSVEGKKYNTLQSVFSAYQLDTERKKTMSTAYVNMMTGINTRTGIYDVEELKEKVKNLNKRVMDLETERDKLNAIVKIDVQLSKQSMEILGL